jgi:cell division protein FtsX
VTGVDSVESSRDRYVHVVGAFRAIASVSRLLAAGLALALLTGLIHLSKMNAYLHRDAVGLLKLWGAGGWSIRAPGVISGFVVGALGGAIAALAWLQGAGWLALQITSLSPMLSDLALPGPATAAALLGVGALMGLVAGALGRAHS